VNALSRYTSLAIVGFGLELDKWREFQPLGKCSVLGSILTYVVTSSDLQSQEISEELFSISEALWDV
jgi:hypothetical protein